MIEKTIAEIKNKLQNAEALDEAKRAELNGLLSALESEVRDLSATKADHAESIAGFAHVSAHEATREDRNPQLLKLAIQGLSSSVKGFETTHPRLVGVVNAICTALSNLGI
jgi:hypothetical protein